MTIPVQGVLTLALLIAQANAGPPSPAPWLLPQGFVEEAKPSSELTPERIWTRSRDECVEHIIEVKPRRPLTLRQYMRLWRRNHGCTIAPLPRGQGLAWAGDDQGTWAGSCVGGDHFAMHVARRKDTFVEIHATRLAGPQRGTADCRAVLQRLLGEIQGPAATEVPSSHRPKRASRAESRRRSSSAP